MAGRCRVAADSMKQAAKRPSPPLPERGIGFLLQQVDPIEVLVLDCVLYRLGSSRRLVTLLASDRPMRNSIER